MADTTQNASSTMPTGALATDASGNVIQYAAAPTGSTPSGTLPPPTNQAPPPPTLANGQTAGGLQMPTNGANLVYDPISNSQVTPEEKAFNEQNAKNTPPPQNSGDVGDTINKAIDQNTPPKPQDITTPNVDAFYNTNETMAQNVQDLMNLFSPPAQLQQLQDQATKISGDKNILSGLNIQSMNLDNLMSGQADSLREEIQRSGGTASEQQIQNLAVTRNHNLLLNQQVLQQKIKLATDAVNNDISLYQNEKDLANTQFSQRTAIYQMVQTNYNNMIAAAKDTAKTIIDAVGYKGYYKSLQSQGPKAVAAGERALGLQAGQLQSLVKQQQYQQNANAIAASGATTPFINKGGEIQAAGTGYAYTSEQDFFNKTGMTIQQAEAKGMVSMLKPSLDIQAKQADVTLKNAQIAQVPLDIAAKKANIAQSYASAAASAASAAKTRLETQQLAQGGSSDAVQQKLEQQYRAVLVKEVNSRSGSLGTEDAKVVQANHLASLLNQYYDPKTGAYNVPKAQYGELVLGLAGMLSKTGTPTDSQTENIYQKTAKGDLNGALTYITGIPQNGSTNAVIKNLADSISRQAQTAMSNRLYAVKLLQGLAPTDLAPERRAALEQNTLAPYTGIKGIDNTNQFGETTPLNIGSTGTIPGSSIYYKILP